MELVRGCLVLYESSRYWTRRFRYTFYGEQLSDPPSVQYLVKHASWERNDEANFTRSDTVQVSDDLKSAHGMEWIVPWGFLLQDWQPDIFKDRPRDIHYSNAIDLKYYCNGWVIRISIYCPS
jgi:hypothetical protein